MSEFSALDSGVLDRLIAICGAENVSTGESVLRNHSRDQSFHAGHLPDVVIQAASAEEIASILSLANQEHIPVTAWGAGSSLEGNPIPIHGGIVLDMVRMDKIVDVHADDFQVTVQPGKPYKDLNRDLARYGLFFPPDPGANATIGGMLANNASGIRTVKYGASKDNVLAMQVALADGRLIRVGSRSVKQSSGYNLLQLFVGSEGTLGIITEATLKLSPVPQYRTTMVATFAEIASAVEAVVAIKGSGIDVAALEFLDSLASGVLVHAGLDIEPKTSLFMEVHNVHQEAMQDDIAMVREICEEMNALKFIPISDTAEQNKLWDIRHGAYESMVRANPGKQFLVMDVAVPISEYPAIIAFASEQLKQNGLRAPLIGHAGDGNIHLNLPYDSEESLVVVKAVNSAIVQEAIRLSGTSTGEHGVGIGKMAYMQAEHGDSLFVMGQVKATLDPGGILNPGKILPGAKTQYL